MSRVEGGQLHHAPCCHWPTSKAQTILARPRGAHLPALPVESADAACLMREAGGQLLHKGLVLSPHAHVQALGVAHDDMYGSDGVWQALVLAPPSHPRPRAGTSSHLGMCLGHGQMVMDLSGVWNGFEVLAHTLQGSSHEVCRPLLSKAKHHTVGGGYEVRASAGDSSKGGECSHHEGLGPSKKAYLIY